MRTAARARPAPPRAVPRLTVPRLTAVARRPMGYLIHP